MMPTVITKAKPRSTSPPRMSSASTVRKVRPPVMMVRDRVSLMLSFISSISGFGGVFPPVLAHAVEDDHGVVHRVADQGEEGGDGRQVELQAEGPEEQQGDHDV